MVRDVLRHALVVSSVAGASSKASLRAVLEVASGSFESWIAPCSDQAEQACSDLGQAVRAAPPDDDDVDALAIWERHRKKIQDYGVDVLMVDPMVPDAHHEYVQKIDRARSELRADGLLAALDAARRWARTSEPLTFAKLSAWQEDILVERRPSFRTAAARRGHHTYGFDAWVPTRFDRCLDEALDPAESWPTRAARLYLDVCFFHPFEGGNARAARVALDALLAREGLILTCITPLVLLRRSALDPNGGRRLAGLLQSLVCRQVERFPRA